MCSTIRATSRQSAPSASASATVDTSPDVHGRSPSASARLAPRRRHLDQAAVSASTFWGLMIFDDGVKLASRGKFARIIRHISTTLVGRSPCICGSAQGLPRIFFYPHSVASQRDLPWQPALDPAPRIITRSAKIRVRLPPILRMDIRKIFGANVWKYRLAALARKPSRNAWALTGLSSAESNGGCKTRRFSQSGKHRRRWASDLLICSMRACPKLGPDFREPGRRPGEPRTRPRVNRRSGAGSAENYESPISRSASRAAGGTGCKAMRCSGGLL